MQDIELKNRILKIAAAKKLREPLAEVETVRIWKHVKLVSPSFQGKSQRERENLVWSGMEEELDDETILSISQCYLLTPEEEAVATGEAP